MTQIYVGNIPYGKDENDLKDLFGQYGEVSSVKFVNDKETGRFRGFGIDQQQVGVTLQRAASAWQLRV